MRVGKVIVSMETILRCLQLPEGEIMKADYDPVNCVVELTIKHNEMPEHMPNSHVETVSLRYTTYENCNGERVTIREPIIQSNLAEGS